MKSPDWSDGLSERIWRPQYPGSPPERTGHDSLLLLPLQVVVPTLLALQQEACVLQVAGQKVAPPLELLGHPLGLLVGPLQLPQLWEEQKESAHPMGTERVPYFPAEAAATASVSLRGRDQALGWRAPALTTCHLDQCGQLFLRASVCSGVIWWGGHL